MVGQCTGGVEDWNKSDRKEAAGSQRVGGRTGNRRKGASTGQGYYCGHWSGGCRDHCCAAN